MPRPVSECYTCNRAARWDVRLYGYRSTRTLACASHIHGLLKTKLSGKWDGYSCEVRKLASA